MLETYFLLVSGLDEIASPSVCFTDAPMACDRDDLRLATGEKYGISLLTISIDIRKTVKVKWLSSRKL